METIKKEDITLIESIIKRHQDRPGPIKLILHDIQHEMGYIPFESLVHMSHALGVSVAEIYGVVSFYSQFTDEPKGDHIINVCMGTACYVKGSQVLLDRVSVLTNTRVNTTSADGQFSLDATRCLGACGLAPVVLFNEHVFGSANTNKTFEENLRQVLKDLKKPHEVA